MVKNSLVTLPNRVYLAEVSNSQHCYGNILKKSFVLKKQENLKKCNSYSFPHQFPRQLSHV